LSHPLIEQLCAATFVMASLFLQLGTRHQRQQFVHAKASASEKRDAEICEALKASRLWPQCVLLCNSSSNGPAAQI